MTQARRYRPAWRGMGLWKWPAIGLVLFCLFIVPFYVQRAGSGFSTFGTWTGKGRLGDCPVKVGTTPHKGGLFVRLRVDPACAAHLAGMTVAAKGAEAGPVEKPVSGNPNTRSARLNIAPSSVTALVVAARTQSGAPVQYDWIVQTP